MTEFETRPNKRTFEDIDSDDVSYVPDDESCDGLSEEEVYSDSEASADSFHSLSDSDHSDNENIVESDDLIDEIYEINRVIKFHHNERIKHKNSLRKQVRLPSKKIVRDAIKNIAEQKKQLPDFVSFALAKKTTEMFDKEHDKCVKHNESVKKIAHRTKRGRTSKPPASDSEDQQVVDVDISRLNSTNKKNTFAICGNDYLISKTHSHIIPFNYNKFSKLCDKYLSDRTIMMIENGSPCVFCSPDIHTFMELHNNAPKFSVQPNGNFFVFTTNPMIVSRLGFSGIIHDQPVPAEWNMLSTSAQRIFWSIHFCETFESYK